MKLGAIAVPVSNMLTPYEVYERERIISQIRIERDKTGGFYKYVHLIIFIYIGILLGTIKTLEFK